MTDGRTSFHCASICGDSLHILTRTANARQGCATGRVDSVGSLNACDGRGVRAAAHMDAMQLPK